MSIASLNDNVQARQDYKEQLFLGTVQNIDDPMGLGRIQAQIVGIYEDGELPWILVRKSSPFGNGPGFGTFGTPAVGSVAIITFQNGDSNYPICEGFISIADSIPGTFQNPNVWGFQDPSGNIIVVDMQSGTLTITHSSGTTISVDSSGNLQGDVSGGVTVTAQDDVRISAPTIYFN